jgi:hypothetical protein
MERDFGSGEGNLAKVKKLKWRGSALPQVGSERFQSRKRFAILLSVGGSFAGDDVVYVTNWKAIDINMPPPGVGKSVDSVWRKDQIEIERAIFELDEILSTLDFRCLCVGQVETEVPQTGHQRVSVLRGLFYENIRVLSRIGESKKNSAGFPNEEIPTSVPRKDIPNFLRLTVFKRGHSPTISEDFLRTIDGTERWYRRNDTWRRPSPACTS